MLPLGGLFLGTKLIPLFPYLRAGMLKKGGGNVDSDGSTRDNRMMIFDHSLKVCPDLKENCSLFLT